MKRPERPERRVVEQFGPELGRRDAVVDPDVCPPPGVRRLARLDGVLIRRGHDRREVVDARMMRPRLLHPDAIADRDPVPVAGRAPPPLWRGSDAGVEVVFPRAGLKDPVSHLAPWPAAPARPLVARYPAVVRGGTVAHNRYATASVTYRPTMSQPSTAYPRRRPAATNPARPGRPDQRGGHAGRVLARLGGTDRRELAGPLLAGRPGYRQGLSRARRPGPERHPEASASPPMIAGSWP